jgi:hypothetical protein
MFIHLGGDVMIPTKEVIAIFDVRSKEKSEITAEFLDYAKKQGNVSVIDPEEPKSFIITRDKVYFSPISSITLKKRAGYVTDLEL